MHPKSATVTQYARDVTTLPMWTRGALAHEQQEPFPLSWIGGQGTEPKEQNTQQSPAKGLSFCPQPLQT